MFPNRFGNMLRSDPLLSASLAVALAAGMAGIFTVTTSAASPEINRAAKSDRAIAGRDLSSIIFDAEPIVGGGRMTNEPAVFDPSRRTMTEQILPERTSGPQEIGPPVKGCESGLSPDISPTAPIAPGRCIVQKGTNGQYASLR